VKNAPNPKLITPIKVIITDCPNAEATVRPMIIPRIPVP
jgi:hypothetical protein